MSQCGLFLLMILLARESCCSLRLSNPTLLAGNGTISAMATIEPTILSGNSYDNTMISFNLSAVSNLTLTSIIYNPTSHLSGWVDKIFGSKSIFHIKVSSSDILDETDLSAEEIIYRSEHFKSRFSLPHYAIWPSCSFELLGFVKVNESGYFNSKIRREVFVGDASLQIKRKSVLWKCFYRVVFENWRKDTKNSEPNFWSVLIYCPAPNIQACRQLNRKLSDEDIQNNGSPSLKSEDGIIAMQVPFKKNIIWKAYFSSKPFTIDDGQREDVRDNSLGMHLSPSRKNDLDSHNKNLRSIPKEVSQSGFHWKGEKNILSSAVCLSIPYTSTDIEKATANGAILLEWIRYYAVLGFKVLIYDRDGANSHHIFGSKYGESQKIRIPKGRLVYHPYTIRGILDPSSKGLHYDNTETILQNEDGEDNLRLGRYESQGHDKVQTLTHCRFEAKALYGIENVLVVDFDEFLYCPVVAATAKAQSGWINQYFMHMKNLGVSQIEFTQRFVGNKTLSPRNCVIDKTKRGESIFDCFGTYFVYNGAHSIKSMHLDHSCPLTGYHAACPSNTIPRSHDCLCTSILMKSNNWKPYEHRKGRECAVVHLSTNNDNYNNELYKFTKEEEEIVQQSTLEVWDVVNSMKKKIKTKKSNQ